MNKLQALKTAIAFATLAEKAYIDDDGSDDVRDENLRLAAESATAAADALRDALRDSDEPRPFELCEEGERYGETMAPSIEDALQVARGNVDLDNYGTPESTIWIDVRVRCSLTGEEGESTVTLDPDEPDCEDDKDHDWASPQLIVGGLKENPGVWGHGGGVIIQEVCMRCGCGKSTDTWAQRSDTGEQGLRSTSYEPGKYAAQIATRKRKAAERGRVQGVHDVECVLAEQGAVAVIATLAPGHVEWDEAARNADAAEHDQIRECYREIYYRAYAEGAREHALKVRDEQQAEGATP